MKTIITLTVLLSVFTSTAFSSNYEEAMKTNILKIDESKTLQISQPLPTNFNALQMLRKTSGYRVIMLHIVMPGQPQLAKCLPMTNTSCLTLLKHKLMFY
ncbi:MAG: hypothetical protein IPF54_12960 [Draconibacterium sp.]|nr:hypothetical protein [Draconibacterium sp.]